MSASADRYTRACADDWVVIRFVDELKVIATLVGPDYSPEDAAHSANRIWPRYFGLTVVPSGFHEALFPLLRAAARSRSIVTDGAVETRSSSQPCYPLGDALYELTAITMYDRWFGEIPGVSIPFEYVELVEAKLPEGFAAYQAKFPGQGILFLFTNILPNYL